MPGGQFADTDFDRGSFGAPNGQPLHRLVPPELFWRGHSSTKLSSAENASGIALTRWTMPCVDKPQEVRNDAVDDSHMISVFLRESIVDLSYGKLNLQYFRQIPFDMFMTGPRSHPIRGIVRTPTDVFRVLISQSLLAECFEAAYSRSPAGHIELFQPQLVRDKTVKRLVLSLVDMESSNNPFGPIFVEGVGLALGAQLIALHSKSQTKSTRNQGGLTKWRLKLATDYIEANLMRPIHLSELSEAVGLSRMHFAAQFRATTTLTPHTYILRRKIFRAEQLLLESGVSIADVALLIGFSSQAHFTEVFKRVTGDTPDRWRKANGGNNHPLKVSFEKPR
jgi:AraC family transcriptional regulator